MLRSVRALHVGILLALAAGILGPLQASAVSITFSATQLSVSSWQYDYTVTNNGSLPGSADVEGIQIFFDYQDYDNLAVVGAPAAWDPLVFQPDAGLALDGTFDALADPGPGLTSGNSLGGFSVSFDWLAGGTPGAQAFEIYDPNNDFIVLETGGFTEATAIPGPAGIWLLGTALAGLGVVRSRASGRVRQQARS
jgi:hypothetical protein